MGSPAGNETELESESYTSRVLYKKKKIRWEVEGIEEIMAEGVLKTLSLDFEMHIQDQKYPKLAKQVSNWRLQLQTANDEPSLSVHVLKSPEDKVMFYKLRATIEKNLGAVQKAEIRSYPNEEYFYEAATKKELEKAGAGAPTIGVDVKEKGVKDKVKKFTFHRQHDFGSSYSSWLPECITERGSITINISIDVCQAVSR